MTDTTLSTIYAVSLVTVRRWRRAGRDASLPAPLTAPEKMPEWWQSMLDAGAFEKSCPQSVLDAARKVDAAMGDLPDTDALPTADTELDALLAAIAAGQGFDYRDGVKVAERNVQVSDLLLLRALRAGDDKKVGPLQRRLNEAQDSLRALQRDRARIEADAGETLPKSEVRTAMLELHGNIQKRFRQGIKAGFPDAAEMAASREAWSLFSDNLVDIICKGLTDSNFAAE